MPRSFSSAPRLQQGTDISPKKKPNASADIPMFAVRSVTIAIHLVVATTVIGAGSWAPRVQAQTSKNATASSGPATVRHYDIPAGPLPAVLTRFSADAGIYLAGSTDLTKGQSSSGLKGNFSIQDALTTLLAGTGLQAVQLSNGGYGLREKPSTASEPVGEAVLPAIQVTASSEKNATTEGRGYAANAVSMFGSTASLKDVPSSVSVITRKQMDDQNITTINEAMRYTTGVSSTNYGDSTAYYKARGFPVNVELDGLSLTNGIQYLQQFDMAMYDRAEIFRGPSGLLAGQGSLGGSVNLVRKMPTDTLQIKSETSIGSWANYRQMVDVSGPLNEEGTLRGRVVGVAGKTNSYVDRQHSREGMGYGVLEYDIDPRTTVALSAGYQDMPVYQYDWGVGLDSANNVVTGPRGRSQNFGPDWNYAHSTIKEANLSLKHRFDNDWNAEATVFNRSYGLDAKYAYDGTPVAGTNTATYTGYQQHVPEDWLGLDAHISGPLTVLGVKNDILFGMNYSSLHMSQQTRSGSLGNYNIFSASDIPDPTNLPYTTDTKTRVDQYSLYGQVNSHLTDKFSVLLGGRDVFFRQQAKNNLPTAGDWTTTAKQDGKFIPYGGLIYALTPQVSAYTSYSKIFSAQTTTTSTGGTLPPFSGEQYEAGFKGSFLDNRLNATIAAFRINGNHLAVSDLNHVGFFVDSGAVRSQGWEAELSGSPTPNWDLIAGYTLANTKYLSSPTAQGQAYDGETPQHLFKLWTNYRFEQEALRGLTVGAGVYVQSSTYRTQSYLQGGYAIFSAKVGYKFNSHLEADLSVNNLFDKTYYMRAPAGLFAQYGEPRSVMLTVRASY